MTIIAILMALVIIGQFNQNRQYKKKVMLLIWDLHTIDRVTLLSARLNMLTQLEEKTLDIIDGESHGVSSLSQVRQRWQLYSDMNRADELAALPEVSVNSYFNDIKEEGGNYDVNQALFTMMYYQFSSLSTDELETKIDKATSKALKSAYASAYKDNQSGY